MGNERSSGTATLGIRHLVRAHWRRITLISGTALVGGSVEALFLLLLTATALSVASPDGDTVGIRFLELTTTQSLVVGLVLVGLRVAAGLAVAAQSAAMKASVLQGTRDDLSKAYLGASWSSQHSQPPGKLQELLTKFADQKTTLVQHLANFVTSTSNLVAMLITALLIEPIGLFAAIVLLACLVLVLRPLRRAIRRRAGESSQAGLAFATAVSETSQLGLEMHTFQVQPALLDRVRRLSEVDANALRRLSFAQAGLPVVYTALAYVALVAGLSVVVAAQPSDVAALGAVIIILLRSLSYGQNVQAASAGLHAGLPFLEVLEAEARSFSTSSRRFGLDAVGELGRIRFDRVSFSYDGITNALTEVDLSFGPRETIGIVGPSGSGKSTFVQLLLRLRSPTAGRVCAGDRCLETFSEESWARSVTFVPQQPRLIAGTIEENIRFFRSWVTLDDIEYACKLANLSPDVAAMPEGLGTHVGEMGGRLSGGQQQRLVIARALVESPQLLVLDEPTSALDVRSEALIRSTLHRLGKQMSVVIVAHRLSTLDVCNRIIVIRDGVVTDFDEPSSLLDDSDFFREMRELSEARPEEREVGESGPTIGADEGASR